MHDLRISIRRLTVVLKLLNNLEGSKKLRTAISDLKLLMKELGPLRDIQVFLKWLDRFSSESGDRHREIRDLWMEEEKQLPGYT